jgi:hypothetical protein
MLTMTIHDLLACTIAASVSAPASLAWRPFIDPLDAHRAWFLLLIPMALFISMVYKGVRLPELDRYWRQVAVMTFQIVVGIIALGAGVFLFIQYIAPAVVPVS